MNHIEVMKLALDALEYWQKLCLDNGRASHELGRPTNAIAALRQAIQEAALQKLTDIHQEMEQKPVAWWNPDESGLAFQKLRGDWQPLYAAPVHAIDTLEKHVDETAKDKHEPDAYGDGNVYRGQRSKDSTTKTLYYTDQEPVAWRTFDGEGNYEFRDYEMNEAYQEEWSKRNPKHQGWVEPLYAAPPRNSWFKLTDAEVWDEWVRAVDESNRSNRELAFRFARAIEAKLKEKNT